MIVIDGTIFFSSQREEEVVLSTCMRRGLPPLDVPYDRMSDPFYVRVHQAMQSIAESQESISILTVYKWINKYCIYSNIYTAYRLLRLWQVSGSIEPSDQLHWSIYVSFVCVNTGLPMRVPRPTSEQTNPFRTFILTSILDQWKNALGVIGLFILISLLLFRSGTEVPAPPSNSIEQKDHAMKTDDVIDNHKINSQRLRDEMHAQVEKIKKLDQDIAQLKSFLKIQREDIAQLNAKIENYKSIEKEVSERSRTDEGLQKEGLRILGDMGVSKITIH